MISTRDGRRLHFERHGDGTPVVVFESGMGVSRNMWGAVLPVVAARTTAVAYDRSGLGRSPRDDAPRDLRRLTDDLLDVLDALGAGPFVLVGHSWGGPIVRAAAAARPDAIAGVVLVDPTDERCDLFFGSANQRQLTWAPRILPAMARVGLLGRFAGKLAATLPEPWRTGMRDQDGTTGALRAQLAELASSIDDLRRLRDDPLVLPDVPVTVISGTKTGLLERSRRPALVEAHAATAAAHPQGRHVHADRSSHYVPFSEPDLVAAEILSVVERSGPLAVPPGLLAAINEEHADSMLLVGRVLGRAPGAVAAEATGVDRHGVDLLVSTTDGTRRVRLDFAEPVADTDALTAALLALVVRARAESGEAGQTSAEREMAERSRLRTFLTEVAAVEDQHPHLRQVTFRGGDLRTFEPCGPDTFLHLLLPPPGRGELTIDRSFSWEQHAAMPDEDKPVGAYYTVRRWRPDVAELDLLMVLHDDAGPASSWARRARPGDPVALWGPRTAYHPPPGTDRYLLVADETGLPAVAAILEHLPDGVDVQVVAESANEAEQQQLPERGGVRVLWLHRGDAPPGTTTLLADAVRSLPAPTGRPYVWGGAESRAMTDVRRHVRDSWGLPRDAVSLVAYWRAGGEQTDNAAT